jgi:hypothetical protein
MTWHSIRHMKQNEDSIHILEFAGMVVFALFFEFACYQLYLKGLKSLERGIDYRSILQISGALLEGVLIAWVLVYSIYKNFRTDKTKQTSRWVVFSYYSICIIFFLWPHAYWWCYSAECYQDIPSNIPWMADYCLSCDLIVDPKKIVFIDIGTTNEPQIIRTCPICGSELACKLRDLAGYITSHLTLPFHLLFWIWWTREFFAKGNHVNDGFN